MTNEMREAFEKWWCEHRDMLEHPNSGDSRTGFNAGHQAATASAEAKYLPVIEKLVEALRRTATTYEAALQEYEGIKAANSCPVLQDAEQALALAAPLLKGGE